MVFLYFRVITSIDLHKVILSNSDYYIFVMSMSSMAGVGSYTASAGGDTLFPITLQIQNTMGGWTPVTVLSDTGNEISIMKREVADSLGLDMNQGESFKVAG